MTTEEEARRWELTKNDAAEVKARSPTLNVLVPAVVFAPSIRECLESFAALAVTSGEAAGFSGLAVYATLGGRLHRITIEDLEPERRPNRAALEGDKLLG